MQWPGQEAQNQQARVPTLVWYDKTKKAVSFGAEALTTQAEEAAEENDWVLAKRFPLHLYSSGARLNHSLQLHPLPAAVTLQQIYSDFLHYLIQSTKTYFEDHIVDGRQIWAEYKPTMELVITHPYGWAFPEQEFIRNAVINTGFVDDAPGSNQILFVTESEATVYFTCYHTNLIGRLLPAANLVVCDVGESMVTMTRFSVIATHPVLKFKEHSSANVQAGGALVDAAVESYLRNLLGNAGLSHEEISEYTSQGVHDFGRMVKPSFYDATVDCTIEVAGPRFNNQSIRTRRGRMTLPGLTVQSFFNDSVNEINTALDGLLQSTRGVYIVLSGKLGDSPFLRKSLKERYEPRGHQLCLTNVLTSKAIAGGAVIWGLINRSGNDDNNNRSDDSDHRALRFSYGFIISTKFDPEAEDHQGRETYASSEGYEKVAGAWSQIVAKQGDKIEYVNIIRAPFGRTYMSSCAHLGPFSTSLFAYSRDDKPSFAKDQQGRSTGSGLVLANRLFFNQGKLLAGFRKICTMTADLSSLIGALQEVGAPGKSYWSLTYDLCLRFGGPELGADIEWQEKGATRTVPVKIKSVEAVYLD